MKVIFFFLCVVTSGLFAKDRLSLGQVPLAPRAGIYDPNQWLTGDSRDQIAESIEIARSKWNAEVYLIILAEQPEMEVSFLTRKVAEEWGKGKLWGVILHVIGDSDSPKFYAGRKENFGWSEQQEKDFSESLEKALKDVESRAMKEGDQRLQVQTGAREFCDELGYLGLVMTRIEKRYETARGNNLQIVRKKYTHRKFLRKLLMVLVPLILLVVGILIYLFRKQRSESKSDYFFPETSPRRRFMAPWSGGADVIVDVGSRLRDDGSRKG